MCRKNGMRTRVFAALTLVVGLVLVPATTAHAQCGPSRTIEENLASVDVAFIGKVVDRSNRDRAAEVQVLEVWKGPKLPQFVTVNGGPEDLDQQTSIDRSFLLHEIYLFMPATTREPFQDSLCSGTQLWSPDGTIPVNLQDAAGNATPVPIAWGDATTQSPDDGGSWGGPATFLVVLVLGVALVLGLLRLGSEKPARKKKGPRRRQGSAPHDLLPTKLSRRRWRFPRFSLPSLFVFRHGSRLDRVRRATRRSRKGPREQEKEQLERAVKPTATRPPSRRNHYTSRRRSAS